MIDPKVFKQVRKALGLSQQELADALGLSRVTVNKMERGRLRRGIPDEVAERLLALKPHHGPGPHVAVHVLNGRHRAPLLTKATPYEDGLRRTVRPNVKPVDDAHLWDNEEDES